MSKVTITIEYQGPGNEAPAYLIEATWGEGRAVTAVAESTEGVLERINAMLVSADMTGTRREFQEAWSEAITGETVRWIESDADWTD